MSPIDHELERALSGRAAGLLPPGDLLAGVEQEARGIRRRRGVLTGAAALSVLAIAVAVPLATRGNDAATGPGTGFLTQPATAAPEPTTSPAPTRSEPPPPQSRSRGVLGWPARGSATTPPNMAMDADMMQGAKLWYAEGHKATESYAPLWRGTLPDGRIAYAFEAIEPSRSFAVFAVQDGPNGEGLRIIQGLELVDRNPQGPAQGEQSQTRLPQVSAYIDGPQDFVVIVGAPTTGQLEFSPDFRRRPYTAVETVDGVGVVAASTAAPRAAYRVRVYDGDGVVVYDGPIDLVRPED